MKKIIISIIIILLFSAGGFFYWLENREETVEEWRSEYSPKENYVVFETQEGKIIKNEKMGLEARIPDAWKLDERWEWFQDGNISLTSPDFQAQSGDLFEGCLIEIGIKNYAKESDSRFLAETKTIKDFIEMCKLAPDQLKKDGYEYVNIDKYEALKTTTTPETKRFISVSAVVRNKIYNFGVLLYSEDKERCAKEFNEFLETISIK